MLKMSRLDPPSRADADALDARSLMAETIRQQRKLMGGLILLALLLAVGFVFMLPLKTSEPYVLEYNKATGEVSVPAQQKAEKFVPGDDSIHYFARRWLRAELSIQPSLNEGNEAISLAMLRGDTALAKHRAFRAEDKTFERIAREPTLVRDVAIDSIASVSGSARSIVANVTLTTSSRLGTQVEKRLVTIYYELLSPRDQRDRELHPIGFYVVDYTMTPQQ
jgi:type IV secretory pathway component VirB8